MDDVPLIPSPLFGLRTWRVEVDEDGERLVGAHRGTPWPGGGRWLTAACDVDADHAAPAPGCHCGIHAWHPSAASARRVLAGRAEVPGVVEADGPIELHEEGFRAQRARPHVLFVAPRRNAAAVQRLGRRHGVPVVTIGSAEELAAYCRDRGLGLPPDVVAELLGPEVRERARRERAEGRRRTAIRAALYAGLVAVVAAFGIHFLSGPPSAHRLFGRSGWVTLPSAAPTTTAAPAPAPRPSASAPAADPVPAVRETTPRKRSRCLHGGTEHRARHGRRGRAHARAAGGRCRSR
jgi:hypothetical protein